MTATGSDLQSIKDLIGYITKSLVDAKEKVEITEVVGTQVHIIEVKVAKEDVGKVIGRNGRTADAIRTIVNCGAAKLGKHYRVEIIGA